MLKHSTYNWTKMLAFSLRRDRFTLPAWIIGVTAFAAGFAPYLKELAGNGRDMAVMFETMKSPAMVAMCGKVFGDENTYGLMLAVFMLVWSAILAASMNIFLVSRHTRKEEEEGRLELIGSLPVGRGANLLSVVVIILASNALVALLIGASLSAMNIESIDAAGSFTYGAAIGASGLVFGAIAILFSQLCATSKATIGYSFAILGLAYLVRAAGDMKSELAACLSPLGLAERTRAFAGNELWPVIVMAGLSAAILLVSFALNVGRDYGQGLISASRGRVHGAVWLSGEWGLAFRLTRGPLAAWAATVFILAAAYGSVFNDMKLFYEGNDMFRAMMMVNNMEASDILGPVVALLMLIMGILGSIPVLMVFLRLRSEEKRWRLEQVYSKSVSKTSNILAYTAIAFVSAALMQVISGLGMWAGASMVMESPPELSYTMKAALAWLPAMLVFIGLAVFIVGLVPKATGFVWVYLVYAFVTVYLGGMMNIPMKETLMKASPFGLLPRWPVEEYDWGPAAGLTGAFVVLTVLGVVLYRRREMETR